MLTIVNPAPHKSRHSPVARSRSTPAPLCPFCGSGVDPGRAADAIAIKAGLVPAEHRVLELLWRSHGAWVSNVRIIDAIYADDIDGGPDSPSAIRAALFYVVRGLRKKLAALNFTIESVRGPHGVYRIATIQKRKS